MSAEQRRGPLAVTGGPAGTTASLADLDRVAADLAERAGAARSLAAEAASVLVSPVLLGSAVLDPPGALRARAEVGVAAAALVQLALRGACTGSAVAAAAESYRLVDATTAASWAAARRALLATLAPPLLLGGAGLLGVAGGGALVAGGSVTASGLLAGLPLPLAVGAGRRAVEREAVALAGRGVATTVRAVPPAWRDDLVEQAVAATGVPAPVLAGAVLAAAPAGTWGATRATAHRVAPPRPGAVPVSVPTYAAGTGDLVRRVQELSPSRGAAPGTVRVDRISGPGREPVAVVHLPSTQEWARLRGANPMDLETNVRAVALQRTASGDGVVRAMRAAGVGRTEPVLLVGYSQGGITAAQLAADPAFRAEFTPRAVLAAGSPVAHMPVPDGVTVLALEHDGDPVPALDGAPNPDRASWTTVRAASGEPAHSGPAYAATGDLVDASSHPSLRAWRADVAPFLVGAAPDGTTVDSTTWVLRRAP